MVPNVIWQMFVKIVVTIAILNVSLNLMLKQKYIHIEFHSLQTESNKMYQVQSYNTAVGNSLYVKLVAIAVMF